MRPKDWERTEELFHRLKPLDPAHRAPLLAEISANDPALGDELQSLLAAHDSQGAFDRLAARVASEPTGEAPSGTPPAG